MIQKKCTVCKDEKNLDQFNWKNRSKGIKKNYCRDCDKLIKKNYYKRNKAKVISNRDVSRRSRMKKFQEWKGTLRCSICPETDSCSLDFHHLDPTKKEYSVGVAAASLSWKKLMVEVNKCVVVCKNCHSKIHFYGLEKYMEIVVGSTPLHNPITTSGLPLIPGDPQPLPSVPLPGDPPTISFEPGKCQKCGLTLYPVMGYVCSTPGCPTGLGSPSFCEPNVFVR